MLSRSLHPARSAPTLDPKLIYWLILIGGVLASLLIWARSPGSPLDDEVAHIVMARNAWNYPEFLLHVWGRVGNTLIYMAPSLFGLNGARLMSLVLSAATVLVTTEVAREMGLKRLYLIPLMLWFQPWFLSLSFIALTEIPFMWFMILGIYLCLRDRYGGAALMAGILPLIRHEGIALTGLWFLYLLANRQWRASLLCWLPLIAYNLIYLVVLQVPFNQTPLMLYFQPQPTTAYGSGSLFHFIPFTIVAIGPPIFLTSLRGVHVALSRPSRGGLLLLSYAAYFVLHTLIYHFGLFASGGYGIFLFPMAPCMAILAALGVDTLFARADTLRRPRGILPAARIPPLVRGLTVALVLGVALFAPSWPRSNEQAAVQAAAGWLKAHQVDKATVMASHAWFFYEYFYDDAWTTKQGWALKLDLGTLPAGTVLVWDAHYSSESGQISLGDLQKPNSPWRELARFGTDQAIIFQKSGS